MKTFLYIIAFAMILIPTFAIIHYQFTHVDMTQTRIFLNMWPWYIPMILGYILLQIQIRR